MFMLEVKPTLVWKRLGMPGPAEEPSIRADFDEAYGRACAALEPKYGVERWRISSLAGKRLTLENGAVLESADLARLATGAKALVAMAATVGEELDALAEEYNAQGETFAMTVADAVGSTAAEELIGLVWRDARDEAEEEGDVVTRRISPGYGDFPLQAQATLLKISSGDGLGIRLTENFMMVPRKSVTAVAAVKPA